ncbi:MAG: MoaD/ThiS family protein [Candidatus Bathyarchaeota archaeon]|nr:MoaD/ThiS family protein [Candidatus Bathyarchaeota archaeon]
MFPSPQTLNVAKPSTLREFVSGLGADLLYAYERRVIVVLVNGENSWPSLSLKPGDRVTIFPIVTGG